MRRTSVVHLSYVSSFPMKRRYRTRVRSVSRQLAFFFSVEKRRLLDSYRRGEAGVVSGSRTAQKEEETMVVESKEVSVQLQKKTPTVSSAPSPLTTTRKIQFRSNLLPRKAVLKCFIQTALTVLGER